MRDPVTASTWTIAVLLAVVFATGILLRPLLPIDETRYLSVAWEMHLSGDYLVPTKNGELYTHKPPLLFWLINAVWSLVGVSDFAARSVAPAFSILNLYLTYRLGRRLFADRTDIAQTAVVVLASFLVYGLYTGLTMFDALLTTMTLVFLTGLWDVLAKGDRRGWAICGIALGLGVLAKGPVILVHTVPLVLFFPLWQSGHLSRREVMSGSGRMILIGLAVVGAWLVPAVILGGEDYRNEILWTQTAGRMANAFDHERPFWFFAALLPLYLFPWSLHLGFWRSVRSLDMSSSAIRFLMIHAVAAVVAFSAIASKQAHYLLPEMPAAALLIASIVAGKTWKLTDNLGALLVLAGAVGLVGYIVFDPAPGPWFPESGSLGTLTLAGFAAVGSLALRSRTTAGVAVWTLAFLATLNLWIAQIPARGAYAMHAFTAHFQGRDGKDIAFFGRPYNAEFNFVGRLTAPVYLPDDRDDLARWATNHPAGLVIAPLGSLDATGEPDQRVDYAGRTFGIWGAGDVTSRTGP